MNEALLVKILDAGLFAFEVGAKRQEIIAEVQKLAATPELIPAALAAMTKTSLDKLDGVTK